MPTIASWVDDLRTAFGERYINGAIRAGLQGRAVFWASEGGHEIGTKPLGLEQVERSNGEQAR